jgi:hypothetical protein
VQHRCYGHRAIVIHDFESEQGIARPATALLQGDKETVFFAL